MMSATNPSVGFETQAEETQEPRNLRSLSRLVIKDDPPKEGEEGKYSFPFPSFCGLGDGGSQADDNLYADLLSSFSSVASQPPQESSPSFPRVTLMLSCSNSYVTESDETISEVQIAGSPVQKTSNFPPEGDESGEVPSKNIFAFGGGRKQAERIVPDGNLKVAVPLTCFADVHRVVLRKNECFSSPFLKMLLEQQVEDEGSSMHVLHVEFPNHKLLKGFIIALDEMKDELRGGVGGGNVQLELDGRNVFEVLSCAAVLSARSIQRICELCVVRTMTAHNFSAAVRYSVAANRPPMIRACYHWLKRVGVEEWRERKAGGRGEKRDERRKVRIDTGALDAVGDIVGGGDGTEQINVNIKRVKFDTAKDEFVCQASGRCSMGIFRTILDDEKKRRSIHFHPGCSSYPVDRSKLEPPFFVDEEAEAAKAKEEEKEEEESKEKSNFKATKKKKDNGFPGTRKCYLERRRGMGLEGNETHYVVYAEDGLDMLVAATSTSTNGVYHFFEDEDDMLRHGDSYIGQMKSTNAGTQFHLYDDGISKAEGGTVIPELERKQKALLIYQTNVLGRVPNAMNIVIPKPGHQSDYGDGDTAGDDSKDSKIDRSSMYAAYSSTAKSEDKNFVVLETKKPRWNPKMEAWTMDFKGRAKLASKKNFILIDSDYEDRSLFLFGKCTKNRWSFDYAYPMNPTTCLFVALTAFSSKLAVT